MTERKIPLDFRILSMLFILGGLWTLFRFKVGAFYFGGDSISNLTRDMATWTILAGGMTLVIVAGHIDLSVGSFMALIAACCAYMINEEYGLGWPATVAVALSLALGILLGLWQGFLVAYFRIPAFIVTLAGLFIYRGLTQKVSAQDPRVPDKCWVGAFGFQYVSPRVGWALAIAACLILLAVLLWGRARRKRLGLPGEYALLTAAKIFLPALALLAYVFKVNQAKGIPYQTLSMAVALLLVYFIARQTRFGRRVFAVGGNPEAARLSGISVEWTTIGVFVLMGFLTAVAGIIWMAQNQGSTKDAGQWYELYAIAACVIGGTSLMGGRGSVFGSLLGALVMATVIQGMDYSGFENWAQLVVRGAVLAVAVGVDVAAKDPAPWMRRLQWKILRKR
ncbi:MAG: sugar ABC transporter permease [Candidatus Sumerlaeota bacterium]|nr:sugar ABC transporter permease [Candidatus Sumerlaeota bacterium]